MVYNNSGACFVYAVCSLQVIRESLFIIVTQRPRLRDQPPSWASPVVISEWKEGLTLEVTHVTCRLAKRCNLICPGGKGLEIFGISTNDNHSYVMSLFRGANSQFIVSCDSLLVNGFLVWSVLFSNCKIIFIGSDCGSVPTGWLCICFCWRDSGVSLV